MTAVRRDGILLLGGGGFIGQALARRLAADGRRVDVVSRSLQVRQIPGVTHHQAGLHDAALLEALGARCGTVVHLASGSTPGSSARHAARELDNLQPTLQLLDILRGWPATHLVFFSSGGTVYGNPAFNPVAEDAPLQPLSNYGAGKVALETFMRAHATPEHPVTILRPSNAFGPGQTLRHGFGLIRTLLQHAMQGTALEVWGDGDSVRDYVYIDDLVDAAVCVIGRRAGGGTFNIGSGCGHSVNALLDKVTHITGRALQVRHRPARSIDVRTVVLDITHARTVLGWSPAVTLDGGLAATWQALQDDR